MKNLNEDIKNEKTYKGDFVELTLLSLTGEKLKQITDGYFSQGRHCIRFDNEYSSGLYFVVMKTSNGITAGKLMICGE